MIVLDDYLNLINSIVQNNIIINLEIKFIKAIQNQHCIFFIKKSINKTPNS